MYLFYAGDLKIQDQNENLFFDIGEDTLFDFQDHPLSLDAVQVKNSLARLQLKSLDGLFLPLAWSYDKELIRNQHERFYQKTLHQHFLAQTRMDDFTQDDLHSFLRDFIDRNGFFTGAETIDLEVLKQRGLTQVTGTAGPLTREATLEEDGEYLVFSTRNKNFTATTWIFRSSQGIATLTEEKTPTEAKMTLTDYDGKVYKVSFSISGDPTKDIAHFRIYLEHLAWFLRNKGALEINHGHLVRPYSRAALMSYLAKLHWRKNEKARFVPTLNHSGGEIFALATSREGITLTDKIPFTLKDEDRKERGNMSVLDLLEFYKMGSKIQEEDLLRGVIPYIHMGLDYQESPHDNYAFLAAVLELVPPNQWFEKTSTFWGDSLSYQDLFEALETGYVSWNGEPEREKTPWKHTLFHAPEILLGYYDGINASSERYKKLKKAFLERELKQDKKTFSSEESWRKQIFLAQAHYLQSIGALLTSSRMEWEEEERAQVSEWIASLMQTYLTTSSLDYESELAHMVVGLRNIPAAAFVQAP